MVLLTVWASLSKSSSIKSTNSFSTYKHTWITNIVHLEEAFHIHDLKVEQTVLFRTCIAWVLSTSGCPAMTTVSPSASPSIRSESVAWPRSRFSTGSASPTSPVGEIRYYICTQLSKVAACIFCYEMINDECYLDPECCCYCLWLYQQCHVPFCSCWIPLYHQTGCWAGSQFVTMFPEASKQHLLCLPYWDFKKTRLAMRKKT